MTADRVRPDYDYYVDRFQEHYRDTYAPTDYDYRNYARDYEPAYRFGYDLAVESPERDLDWDNVEPEARRKWEAEYRDRPWNDYRDAIRHAWYEVREEV